jgi:uncharacterized protein YraI
LQQCIIDINCNEKFRDKERVHMNAANSRSPRQWFSLFSLICILLLGTAVVRAQPTPVPISIGENQLGNIAAANGNVRYSLSVPSPQSVEIQVLAVTPGFLPAFTVFDQSGGVVLSAANLGSQSVVQGTANLLSPGAYTIEVSNANATGGQFLISVQAGEPLIPALVLGENQIGMIADASSRVRYSLSVAAPQSVNLQVLAITPGFAPAFRVLGADDGVLFDAANPNAQNIARGIVDLPAAFTYIVEVRSANNMPGQYLISPQPNAPLATSTPLNTAVPTGIVTPEPDAACSVAPSGSQDVNVRFGPGTTYNIIGFMAQGASAPVIGRLADNSWYQINRNGQIGWVSATVVTLTENCGGVPVVAPPPPPPTQPASTTSAPSTTPNSATQAPTATPTANSDGGAPTATATPGQGGTTGGIVDHVVDPSDLEFVELEPVDTRPDLLIYGVNLQQTTNNDDTPYYLSFVISNRGGSTAPGPISVRLCIVASCYDTSYAGIGAGGASGIGFPLGRQFIGMTATYTLFVDYADTISETDESNNFVTGTFTFPG